MTVYSRVDRLARDNRDLVRSPEEMLLQKPPVVSPNEISRWRMSDTRENRRKRSPTAKEREGGVEESSRERKAIDDRENRSGDRGER